MLRAVQLQRRWPDEAADVSATFRRQAFAALDLLEPELPGAVPLDPVLALLRDPKMAELVEAFITVVGTSAGLFPRQEPSGADNVPLSLDGSAPLVDDGAVPLLLTVPEVADALRLSLRSVERLVAEGTLPSVRVRSSVRIRRDDLETYVAGLPPAETKGAA